MQNRSHHPTHRPTLLIKQILEPLAGLLSLGSAQTLATLHRGTLHRVVTTIGLTPILKLSPRKERPNDTATRKLKQRSSQAIQESLPQERRPESAKTSHQRTLDAGTVLIPVSHDHHTTTTKRLRIPADLTPLKSKDLLNGSQLLIFVELLPTKVLHVQHFTTKRDVTPILTTINHEARPTTAEVTDE
jgi:hypothetical protein